MTFMVLKETFIIYSVNKIYMEKVEEIYTEKIGDIDAKLECNTPGY